eukprot:14489855-Alexandrium_andersonii.AAC.1
MSISSDVRPNAARVYCEMCANLLLFVPDLRCAMRGRKECRRAACGSQERSNLWRLKRVGVAP